MLHQLDYFDRKGEFYFGQNVKDNLGNIYDYGIYNDWDRYWYSWYSYYIKGKYRKMKGTLAIQHKYRDTNRENWLKVYGDDKLLYSSPIMTGGSLPTDFEIDLTGVLELTVEIKGSDIYLANTGLYQ